MGEAEGAGDPEHRLDSRNGVSPVAAAAATATATATAAAAAANGVYMTDILLLQERDTLVSRMRCEGDKLIESLSLFYENKESI